MQSMIQIERKKEITKEEAKNYFIKEIDQMN